MQHADDLVERAAVHRNPAVAALGEHHPDVIQRRVLLHRHELGARGHDLAHRPYAERHHPAHHHQLVVGPEADRGALAPDRAEVGRALGTPRAGSTRPSTRLHGRSSGITRSETPCARGSVSQRGTRYAASSTSGTPDQRQQHQQAPVPDPASSAGSAAPTISTPSDVVAEAAVRSASTSASQASDGAAPRSRRPTARVSSARLTVMSAAPAVAPKTAIRSPTATTIQIMEPPAPRHPTGAISAIRCTPTRRTRRRTTWSTAEPVPLQVDALAGTRHPPELGQHQPADGAHVLPGEAVAEHVLQLGERDAAFDPELVGADDLDRRDLVGVVLVLDLADDLLQDVLQRHEAGRAAELVHHDREMARAALEVPELAVERLAFGHERGGTDHGGPRRAVVGPGEDVLGVDHAGDGVGMAVEHQAGARAPSDAGWR